MRKSMQAAMMLIVSSAAPALAATGTQAKESMGLAAYLFLGFLALVVVTQLVPAVCLLAGMAKGLISPQPKASRTR